MELKLPRITENTASWLTVRRKPTQGCMARRWLDQCEYPGGNCLAEGRFGKLGIKGYCQKKYHRFVEDQLNSSRK